MLALLLVAEGAWAKSSKEFDQHIAEAQRAYSEKSYDKAIEEFDAAYRRDPEPALLINIGRCHYLANRPREALDYYNTALRGKLTRSEREEVTASVAKATIKYQEQQQKKAQEEAQRAAAEHAALAAALRSPPPKPPEKKPFYKTGWFWGILGGAVATGATVGIVLAVRSVSPTRPSPPDGEAAF